MSIEKPEVDFPASRRPTWRSRTSGRATARWPRRAEPSPVDYVGDPIRLFAVGHTYLEGWCRLTEARRTFPAGPGRRDPPPSTRRPPRPSWNCATCPPGWCSLPPRTAEVVIEVGTGGRCGRRVLPARLRRGTPRRRSADHPAHPGPRLPAPARAAPGWRRPHRHSAGARRQRPRRRARGARRLRGRALRARGGETTMNRTHLFPATAAGTRPAQLSGTGPVPRGRRPLPGRLPRLPRALRTGRGGAAAGDRRHPPHHLLHLHLPRLRGRGSASPPGERIIELLTGGGVRGPCVCTPPCSARAARPPPRKPVGMRRHARECVGRGTPYVLAHARHRPRFPRASPSSGCSASRSSWRPSASAGRSRPPPSGSTGCPKTSNRPPPGSRPPATACADGPAA
ncbi:hypothetical protein SCALM49S_00012 [Streptomyces californicus]